MAWTSTLTDAGAALVAAAFGATLNYTALKLGAGSVDPENLAEQTDVTDYVKDFDIVSLGVSGSTSTVNGRLDNSGLTEETPLTQMGLFANLNNSEEVLLMIYQTDTPSTIPTPEQQPGWVFEPQLDVIVSNVANFTANINWDAYAKVSDIQQAADVINAFIVAVDNKATQNALDIAAETERSLAAEQDLSQEIADESARAKASEQGLQAQADSLSQSVSAIQGQGGYIDAVDFETDDPTQEQLTAHACENIFDKGRTGSGTFTWDAEDPSQSTFVIDGVTHYASEIFNGTRVENLSNNQTWALANTPNTTPVVFWWSNKGYDNVAIATDSIAGIVKGGGDVEIAHDGTMSVPGKQDSLNSTQLETVNSGVTAEKVNNFEKSTFILPSVGIRTAENVLLYDDLGASGIYVRIPKFKISDVIVGGSDATHPAFIVNGKEIDAIYVSKYQNVVMNNRAYSLPWKDPAVNLNFDQAVEYCKNKGKGWHLMTNAEWAAVALWCKANGLQPHGNNINNATCADVDFPDEKAVMSGTGTAYRSYTGSGPVTFNHNCHESGICDLNGNVWEWNGGLRLNNGEIQILANNDAADNTKDLTASSPDWKAILQDGSLVAPGTANTLKYDYTAAPASGATTMRLNTTVQYPQANDTPYANPLFGEISSTVTVPEIMKALALMPNGDAAAHGNDKVWMRNNGERLPRRGGYWDDAANAGVFALTLSVPRSGVSTVIGCRAAFCSL